MKLIEMQRRMAALLMLPLTSQDRIARKSSAGVAMKEEAEYFIKPNSLLTSQERLEIYSRSYWFRILDSFRDDFPGLEAILGSVPLERMARAYLVDCPSQSFTLRDLGSRLETWLKVHPRFGGRNHLLAVDMARLEWAHILAFDGPSEKPLGPEDLADLKPGLRVGVQPYLSLLRLQYPVDDIRIEVNKDSEGAAASNVALRKPRIPVARLHQRKSEPIFLAVHRVDLSVYYRRLSVEEFRLLTALRDGRSIAAAIHSAFDDGSALAARIPELLKLWFATWSEFGWLTARPKSYRGLPS